jgi:hypothetical protein
VTLSDVDVSRAVSPALRHEPWLYELGWMGRAGHRSPSCSRRCVKSEMAQVYQGGRLPDVTFVLGGSVVEIPRVP